MSVHNIKTLRSADMLFSEFWENYPRKVVKFQARKMFDRLSIADQKMAIETLPNHIEYWRYNASSIIFVPHASTWLHQRRFEDELTCELPTPKNCSWPKCKENGQHQYGTSTILYCAQHIETFKRGGTPPR